MKKFLLALALMMTVPLQAHAVALTVNSGGKIEPLPIAIPDFNAMPGADTTIADGIPQVITADLKGSGLFAPLDHGAFVQDPASIQKDGVHFAEWKAINAKSLVTGNVSRAGDGRTRVEFRLWDTYGQKQMVGMAYTTTQDNWRRIAHIIADQIYTRITGEGPYFDSRIVYVAESGPGQ